MAKLTGKAKAKFLARMKKGRKAAKKSGGKKKKSNKKSLEKRIAELERIITFAEKNSPWTRTEGVDKEFTEREKLRKELDAGDW